MFVCACPECEKVLRHSTGGRNGNCVVLNVNRMTLLRAGHLLEPGKTSGKPHLTDSHTRIYVESVAYWVK